MTPIDGENISILILITGLKKKKTVSKMLITGYFGQILFINSTYLESR